MIRVLLVDDHALFRQGLKGLLARAPDIRVVAEAGGYAQALEVLRANDITVVVTDLSMPGRDGIELVSHVKAVNSAVAVLVLTMHEDFEHAYRALHSGAAGYMTKAASSEEVISAVRRVAGGGQYVSESVSASLVRRFTNNGSAGSLHTTLSDREFRVFEMLVRCKTVTHIARELSLSVKTVSSHKTRVLKKMGMQHQGELVRYAIEHDLDIH